MTIPELLNNRYRVIKILGEGGFGRTYLAEDRHLPSHRRCVIKQLKPYTSDPEIEQLIRDRFAREAALLESLGEHHDQIPSLYAYFWEQGEYFLVQEWIQGMTISDWLYRQGPMSEAMVTQLLISILGVLDYVHSHRIVHRDIKPDNIMIRQSDRQPMLIDFGIVKESVTSTLGTDGQLVHTMAVGTPGFMSSDQAAGRPVYSSDLYSLALTAIYMLTGKLPQQFSLDPNTGKIIWQQAVSIHPRLAQVLDIAIEYHPRDRFKTARDMLEALDPQTVPCVPISVPAQAVPPSSAVQIPSGPTHQLARSVPSAPLTSQSEIPGGRSHPSRSPAILMGLGVVSTGITLALLGLAIGRPFLPDPSNPTPTPAPISSSPIPTPTPIPSSPTPAPISSSPTPSPTPIPSSLTPAPIPVSPALQTPAPPPSPALPPPPRNRRDPPPRPRDRLPRCLPPPPPGAPTPRTPPGAPPFCTPQP